MEIQAGWQIYIQLLRNKSEMKSKPSRISLENSSFSSFGRIIL